MAPVPPTGCSKRSSNEAAGESQPEAYPQGYVEDCDEPRTKLGAFFSSLLAFLDGHVLPAMLTGINLVWTEQFILAKLFKPMGQPPRHPSQRE